MWKDTLRAAGASALLLATAGSASAAGFALNPNAPAQTTLVQKTHSVEDAYGKLHRHGYYDIRVQRASEPYSFIACKHGARYHIHVNYYGDFEQVDQVGSCGGYGYGTRYSNGYDDDNGRRYSNGYDDEPGYYRRKSYYGYGQRAGGYLRPLNEGRYYGYRRVHDDY